MNEMENERRRSARKNARMKRSDEEVKVQMASDKERQRKRRKSTGDKKKNKTKGCILEDAQWDYWRDKPFEMNEEELTKAVEKSKLLAEDVVRMIKDYNMVLGPKVRTCVCALCNDFCTQDKGRFWENAKERLGDHYRVGCSDVRWGALSALERRFRHIVNVGGGTCSDAERYFIGERGMQNRVDGKWEWWTDDDTGHRDFKTARVFVCHACNTPKTGRKRWLMNSDPAKISEDLKKIPLNMSEKLVLNEYVIFNNTVILDIVKENHLSGHVISIPIHKRDERSRETRTREFYPRVRKSKVG